jgi:hypothetical protein
LQASETKGISQEESSEWKDAKGAVVLVAAFETRGVSEEGFRLDGLLSDQVRHDCKKNMRCCTAFFDTNYFFSVQIFRFALVLARARRRWMLLTWGMSRSVSTIHSPQPLLPLLGKLSLRRETTQGSGLNRSGTTTRMKKSAVRSAPDLTRLGSWLC